MKFRPRLSLRLMLILLTIVCLYMAAWRVTEQKGVGRVTRLRLIRSASSPAPFVVQVVDVERVFELHDRRGYYSGPGGVLMSRKFYLWWFGYYTDTGIGWFWYKAPDGSTMPIPGTPE